MRHDWRVEVLFSQTAVTQAIGRTQNATLLAIKEINSNGGGNGLSVRGSHFTGRATPIADAMPPSAMGSVLSEALGRQLRRAPTIPCLTYC